MTRFLGVFILYLFPVYTTRHRNFTLYVAAVIFTCKYFKFGVSTTGQMFNFVLLSQKRWFRCNARMFRTHFASVMTLNNCEIIAETQKVTFSDEFLAVVDVVFA